MCRFTEICTIKIIKVKQRCRAKKAKVSFMYLSFVLLLTECLASYALFFILCSNPIIYKYA